jgi:hypothetical protein
MLIRQGERRHITFRRRVLFRYTVQSKSYQNIWTFPTPDFVLAQTYGCNMFMGKLFPFLLVLAASVQGSAGSQNCGRGALTTRFGRTMNTFSGYSLGKCKMFLRWEMRQRRDLELKIKDLYEI